MIFEMGGFSKLENIFSFEHFDNAIATALNISYYHFNILVEEYESGDVVFSLFYQDNWENRLDEKVFLNGEKIDDEFVDLYATRPVFRYNEELQEPIKIKRLFVEYQEEYNLKNQKQL